MPEGIHLNFLDMTDHSVWNIAPNFQLDQPYLCTWRLFLKYETYVRSLSKLPSTIRPAALASLRILVCLSWYQETWYQINIFVPMVTSPLSDHWWLSGSPRIRRRLQKRFWYLSINCGNYMPHTTYCDPYVNHMTRPHHPGQIQNIPPDYSNINSWQGKFRPHAKPKVSENIMQL